MIRDRVINPDIVLKLFCSIYFITITVADNIIEKTLQRLASLNSIPT